MSVVNFFVCRQLFLDFLENFAYLSLTLNFWLHRISQMMIGQDFGLVDPLVTEM